MRAELEIVDYPKTGVMRLFAHDAVFPDPYEFSFTVGMRPLWRGSNEQVACLMGLRLDDQRFDKTAVAKELKARGNSYVFWDRWRRNAAGVYEKHEAFFRL